MNDMTKLQERVLLLKRGKQLLMVHKGHGDYVVWMNPQQNRLLVKPVSSDREGMSEELILSLLFWNCGVWYIYEEPVITPCSHCAGRGIVESVAQALVEV